MRKWVKGDKSIEEAYKRKTERELLERGIIKPFLDYNKLNQLYGLVPKVVKKSKPVVKKPVSIFKKLSRKGKK